MRFIVTVLIGLPYFSITVLAQKPPVLRGKIIDIEGKLVPGLKIGSASGDFVETKKEAGKEGEFMLRFGSVKQGGSTVMLILAHDSEYFFHGTGEKKMLMSVSNDGLSLVVSITVVSTTQMIEWSDRNKFRPLVISLQNENADLQKKNDLKERLLTAQRNKDRERRQREVQSFASFLGVSISVAEKLLHSRDNLLMASTRTEDRARLAEANGRPDLAVKHLRAARQEIKKRREHQTETARILSEGAQKARESSEIDLLDEVNILQKEAGNEMELGQFDESLSHLNEAKGLVNRDKYPQEWAEIHLSFAQLELSRSETLRGEDNGTWILEARKNLSEVIFPPTDTFGQSIKTYLSAVIDLKEGILSGQRNTELIRRAIAQFRNLWLQEPGEHYVTEALVTSLHILSQLTEGEESQKAFEEADKILDSKLKKYSDGQVTDRWVEYQFRRAELQVDRANVLRNLDEKKQQYNLAANYYREVLKVLENGQVFFEGVETKSAVKKQRLQVVTLWLKAKFNFQEVLQEQAIRASLKLDTSLERLQKELEELASSEKTKKQVSPSISREEELRWERQKHLQDMLKVFPKQDSFAQIRSEIQAKICENISLIIHPNPYPDAPRWARESKPISHLRQGAHACDIAFREYYDPTDKQLQERNLQYARGFYQELVVASQGVEQIKATERLLTLWRTDSGTDLREKSPIDWASNRFSLANVISNLLAYLPKSVVAKYARQGLEASDEALRVITVENAPDIWMMILKTKADIYKKLNQSKKRIECYEMVLKINPNDSDALQSLLDFSLSMSNYSKAYFYQQRLATLEPGDLEVAIDEVLLCLLHRPSEECAQKLSGIKPTETSQAKSLSREGAIISKVIALIWQLQEDSSADMSPILAEMGEIIEKGEIATRSNKTKYEYTFDWRSAVLRQYVSGIVALSKHKEWMNTLLRSLENQDGKAILQGIRVAQDRYRRLN